RPVMVRVAVNGFRVRRGRCTARIAWALVYLAVYLARPGSAVVAWVPWRCERPSIPQRHSTLEDAPLFGMPWH
ncbi:MAG TPA: hypothetical protein VED63_01980, partial [Acidimicrobiales bacterium]|nr:hypothetical protein [Acidimicrobiales bacterium]